jgi:hypothetical protein
MNTIDMFFLAFADLKAIPSRAHPQSVGQGANLCLAVEAVQSIGRAAPGGQGRLPGQQQRMGRVAGPARLADHHVEAERRKIVGVGVDVRVFRLIKNLRVSSAFIAGLGARETGIALQAAKRERARPAADNADRASMVPSGRAERAIEIARARVLARGGDKAR